MDRQLASSMVKSPYVADPDMTLHEAIEYMEECNIRHLPVTDHGKLMGLVSERDVREALGFEREKPLALRDIMRTQVFTVSSFASLRDVVLEMAEHKYGSVVITNPKKEVLGIFTTIDALRILADLLDKEEMAEVISLEDYIETWTQRPHPASP